MANPVVSQRDTALGPTEGIVEPVQETVLERQYGLSHADLHRILPRFVEAHVTTSGASFALEFPDARALTLSLGPEQERRLGLIRIPYVDLRFVFTGWGALEIENFMRRFDQMFQKGGG